MKDRTDFPPQKKNEKEKTKNWAEKCTKAGCDMGIYTSTYMGEYREMRINRDLYNSVLDSDDMMSMCDPMNVQSKDFPFAPQHYPIANGKINLLAGEEEKRRFDWKLAVINPDAISEKERNMKDLTVQKLTELASSNQSKQEMMVEMRNFDNFLKYEYQDIRERRGTHLLRHVMAKEEIPYKWTLGFMDGLIEGREIYALDVVNGDPRVRKCNPSQVKVIRKGNSPDVADADIIVEWGYHSRGNVIDDFNDFLSPKQVTHIENSGITSGASSGTDESVATGAYPDLMAGTFSMIEDADGNLVPSDAAGMTTKFLAPFGEDGSVLVTRVVWRAYRKIGKLVYYDERTGVEEKTFVDEFYEPRLNKGERIEKYIWVTDWWEGTRIGEDIYVKMQPFPVKSHDILNPTGTLCPYVGGDYTVEGEPTTSLMARMKPYAYYYDFLMHKQWETMTKHKGTVGYLDLAMIPEGWDEHDAIYFAEKMGWFPIDSFKEAKKGAATGALAGNMNNNRVPMNFDMGNYIEQNMLMLNFLKEEISTISGVTRQREGAISNHELVGNTERAVMQSSHITEIYFALHDRIKLAVLRATLELAKFAYKGRNIHVMYVTDEQTMFNQMMHGDDFAEIHYGLTLTNTPDYENMKQSLTQIAQAGLQRDKVNLGQIMDILMDPSISSKRRKIENAEVQKGQQEAEAAKQQQQAVQQVEEMKMAKAQELEEFRAAMNERLEKVREEGSINLAKVKGVIEHALKTATSADVVEKIDSELNKVDDTHAHESRENRLDRESAERIAKQKINKAPKSA